MDLEIKDVADLLNVSERTIKEWINQGTIPNYRIDQHYYFSRTEIENWVISHKLDKTHGISPFIKSKEPEIILPASQLGRRNGNKQFSLFRAIHKGDVLHDIIGKTKEEIIRKVMKKSARLINTDADVMTDLLLDREQLMPTALNNGIAVPHTRDSLHAHHDTVIVVFLDYPLNYGALDEKPVHTLFFLFASDDKRHLHLLAKIAHLSSQPEALEFFRSKPSKDQLLAFIKEWEAKIPKTIR